MNADHWIKLVEVAAWPVAMLVLCLLFFQRLSDLLASLIRRIDLFEEQSAKYRHPANADITPGTITYETLDIEFRETDYSEDDCNPIPCSNCNREDSVGMWLLEVERNGYNEIISGPLCSSCYVDMSHDYYGGNEVS